MLICVVLTADKGVALVVMDKSQYIDKCMVLLDDTKVYKSCRDTTKNCTEMSRKPFQQLNRDYGSSRHTLVEQTPLQQFAPHR